MNKKLVFLMVCVVISSLFVGVYVTAQGNGWERARVAVDGTGVYIAGYDYASGDWRWRIEKRQP